MVEATARIRSSIFPGAKKARREFLNFFPEGFYDETYIAWERAYKWKAHEQWQESLNQLEYRRLLRRREYAEIAKRAVRIESRTNLLFSFEKMAVRDAIKSSSGAQKFATGLFDLLHGSDPVSVKFDRWCDVVATLPRKQTRVLTWPLASVFGFIAQPKEHMFFKPNVTREAARKYGFDLEYKSRPAWDGYKRLLEFARVIRHDVADLKPRDLIDIQSFIWVLGSDEY
jgi:hypothetical protein